MISIDLEDPRFDPVFQYANAVNPDRSVQESIRDLLLQAVSDEPMNAAIREAKRQVYKETRERILHEAGDFLRELARTLDLEPVGDETRGLPAPMNAILDPDPKGIFE